MRERNAVALVISVFGALFAVPSAFALNPSMDVGLYAHTPWKIREGLFNGVIVAIAQTVDGYLWLGTEYGVVRFDGVHFVSWQPPAGQQPPNIHTKSLLASRDGSLWIGTSEGLARWKDGRLTHYPEFAGKSVGALVQDRQGLVWAGVHQAPYTRLCAIRLAGRIQCFGEDGVFGQTSSESPNATFISSLYEDSQANLWVGGVEGLWRWNPGPPRRFQMPDRVQALVENEPGALAIATLRGVERLASEKSETYAIPGVARTFPARAILRDRDGGLWIGTTDRGVVHVHQGKTDVFGRPDGLSADFVETMFEDREGDIWVATIDGLDRFHDLSVPTISERQGLSNATVESVLVARDGAVWLGTMDGLDRWNNGRIDVFRKKDGLPDPAIHSLFQDAQDRIWVSTLRGLAILQDGRFIPVPSVPGGVQSIVADRDGTVWVSQSENLYRIRDGKVVQRIPWANLGHHDYARASTADLSRGGLWLGFRGAVEHYHEGRIQTVYRVADGLGEGRVRHLQFDDSGALWVSTQGGVSRVKDGQVATLSSKNGLPCDDALWALEEQDRSLWIYMACGLVHVSRQDLDGWIPSGGKGRPRQVQVQVLDASDGVRSHSSPTGYSPAVARSQDGKFWFLPWDGVSVLDGRHLAFNGLPPPVQIEQVTADHQSYRTGSGIKGRLELPARLRDLQIDYTALSLVAPEKIHFKYMLEGHDRDWQDVGNRRQAFYNDLSPQNYRFRVMASNNSGVWNQAGGSLDFSIDPAYYQTTWFRVSCVAVFFAMLWALYRYRLHQIGQEFAARLEERTRIARELHDTMLQSFQGSLLVMGAARNLLSGHPEQAGQTLDRAINMAVGAIGEGRDAIQDLRCQPAVQSDLAQLLTATGRDLAQSKDANGNPVIFRVAVEGERQDLDPIIQDEAHRIARELLRNAFRHARASQIEADIRYDDRLLRVLIRDDGEGIKREVIEAGGRPGHWGLLGMRERAKRIGARLEFWSEAGAGTEVELSIPASIAYGAARSGRFQLLRKKKANP